MAEVMSHNQRLMTIGETTRSVVRRILATWERATPADVEAGARWYAEQERIIDVLAAQTGRSRETVAAVVAHLSPRTFWQRNIEGARDLLTGGSAAICLVANVGRARRAMGSADPLGTLNGPKTARFARNLLGDREAVTVDIWAARVALGERDDLKPLLDRVGMYGALEHAYQVAARRVGVDATTLQATVWVVARNGRAD